jgi:hypothetical protein
MIRAVAEALTNALPAVATSIEIIDFDRHALRTEAASGTRTLVVRSVDAAPPMIETWVRYVVSTALSSNRPLITAVRDFHTDLMAQRYCCQLAMIHGALFHALPRAPVLTDPALIGAHLRELQNVSLHERHSLGLTDAGTVRRIDEALRAFYQDLDAFLEPHVRGHVDALPDFHGSARLALWRSPLLDAIVELALERFHAYPGVAPG